MKSIKDLTTSYQKEMIKSLQECIKIKSISGETEGPLKNMEFFLNLAQSMGFKTANIDNLGGIIEFGEGTKTFGIIVHLDTVPEGQGWTFPPFEGQLHNGKIYGRGAIDDKGPAISALYALKAVKESGLKPACKIQIIVGIDEETVWNTTPKLLQKIKEPDFSFVPDSKFPIVIAEKGLIWLEMKKDFTNKSEAFSQTEHLSKNSINGKQARLIIKDMNGGSDSINIVPDYCEAVLQHPESYSPVSNNSDNPAYPKKINDQLIEEKLKGFLESKKSLGNNIPYKIELEKIEDGYKLISHGKSAHAFNCAEGHNAISQLIAFLSELEIAEEQKHFLDYYSSKIGMNHYGDSLGLALEDQLTGKLTISPGYIKLDDKKAILKVDIRFPADEHLDSMIPKIKSAFREFNGTLNFLDTLESLSFSEDDPNIQTLLQVYRDYSGDKEAKPLGMGGTTFSKAFKHAVAFGPAFPGMTKVEHQPDEYIEIDHLMKCCELYALAIKELADSE